MVVLRSLLVKPCLIANAKILITSSHKLSALCHVGMRHGRVLCPRLVMPFAITKEKNANCVVVHSVDWEAVMILP
jgi:hypothetical protein